MFQQLLNSDNEVFLALLAGGFALLTSILTAIFNRAADVFFKNRDFKRDYHKKVIEKRMHSYSEIENVTNDMTLVRYSMDHSKRHFDIFSSHPRFSTFYGNLVNCFNHSLWVSPELLDIIRDLIFLLSKISKEIDYEQETDQIDCDLQSLGNKNHKEALEKIQNIKKGMLKDIRSFYNVEGFLEAKAKKPR